MVYNVLSSTPSLYILKLRQKIATFKGFIYVTKSNLIFYHTTVHKTGILTTSNFRHDHSPVHTSGVHDTADVSNKFLLPHHSSKSREYMRTVV